MIELSYSLDLCNAQKRGGNPLGGRCIEPQLLPAHMFYCSLQTKMQNIVHLKKDAKYHDQILYLSNRVVNWIGKRNRAMGSGWGYD